MRTFKQFILENNQISSKLSELIDLINERYQPELRDFLDRMAAKDKDIREILLSIDDAENTPESDQIYKNSADDNHGNSDQSSENGEN